MSLTRRCALAALGASAIAPLMPTVGAFVSADDFLANPIVVEDFVVLASDKVQFSSRAVRWAQYVSKVQGFDVTELREAMTKSVLGGYWPYEAPA